jgi:hypothetical protein
MIPFPAAPPPREPTDPVARLGADNERRDRRARGTLGAGDEDSEVQWAATLTVGPSNVCYPGTLNTVL